MARKGEISEDDFGHLMKDETFVDFFNVFLSLPTFSQRLMYMYDKKTFQFDPPLKRRQQVLEKQNLTKWLREQRLPYFARSEYYLEYLLCEQLMMIRPHFSASSHHIDYEKFRILEDKTLVRSVIGHVVGMCQFRLYLTGSTGARILEFWKDAERFHRTRHRGLRQLLFREIQIKYYKPEGLTNVGDHGLWQALYDGATAADFNLESDENLSDLPASFRDLQNSVMTLLQQYWLQKYLLHHKALRDKELPPPDDATKIQSVSDLRLLQDMEDIDKALSVAQGATMPNKNTKAEGAKANWMSMFPGVQIDDTFLTSPEDIVTSHVDGEVTLNRLGSEFDVMLERYFESSSSSSESSSQEELQWDVAPMYPKLIPDEVDPEQVTQNLVAQIAEEEQRRKTIVTDNLALFEQIQGQNQAQGQPVSLYSEIDLLRHRTCESSDAKPNNELKGTGSMHANLKLPSLKASHGVKAGPRTPSHQRQKLTRKNLISATKCMDTLPSLSTGDMARVGEREPACVTPLGFSYTNISEGNYRYDNKVLVRSLAADLLCGRPFVTYLLRYKHEEVARRVRLWEEIHVYLSVKTMMPQEPRTTQLRHWKANQLILRFLNETDPNLLQRKKGCCPEFVKLPPGVSAAVRKLIVMGKADSLLTHVQDYLSQSLHGLWKSYVHMDRETFMESAIYNKPGGRIHRSRQVPVVPSITARRRGERILPPLAQGNPSRGLRREAESPIRGKQQKDKQQDKTKEASEENKEEKSQESEQGSENKEGDEKENSKSPVAENKEPTEKKDTEEVEDENGMLITQEDHKGLLERRMWRALQLAAYVNTIDLEPLLMDPLPVKDLVYNGDETSGSLTLKKLLIMKRRDLIEQEERRRAAVIAAYTHRLQKQQAKEKADMPPEIFDESIPEWAKPFKGENKRWVYRPPRPRTMTEILKHPYSIEFFRKFLVAHGNAGQLNFWCDVESLKMAKDLTYRQQKINQILRRYFLSQKGYLSLECNDDVIKEIPKMEKVTPAMLISGQSCILKLLEEKWFAAYQATFPEVEEVQEELTPEQKEKKRKWTTDRSRALWISFVRTVMRFRHSIMDKEMTQMFGQYLKNEIVKETERQKAAGNIAYVPGLPIKKVIKNRLIDVTKLLNDLAFLAEAERFRALCDNAAEAARQGIYRTGDQYMLDLKAKTIIMCYLDSEIPPKIQINASTEVADNILSTFQSGLVDRGLFHDANMHIFPVMAYIWKKFQRIRFAQMLGFHLKGEEVPVVLQKAVSVNFMDINHADCKKVISVHEDDPPRMLFSLSNGLRIITPPTREQLLKRALEATRAASEGRNSRAGGPSTRSMTMATLGDPHLAGKTSRNQSPRELHQIRQSARRGSRGSLASVASDASLEDEVDDLSLRKRRGAFSSARKKPSAVQI